MSSFTTPLIGSYNDDMTKFTLTESFSYYDNDGVVYTVPKGFVTDFASSPKIVQWFIPPTGKYGKAAVLHDYQYSSGIVSKSKADRLFREAMLVLKVPHWKAEAMYLAVKRFGASHYKSRV